MTVTVYDTRTRLHRALMWIKRVLASRIAAAGTRGDAVLRRYRYAGRHHQRHDLKQYRTVRTPEGKAETVSYYLEPSLRQRIAAVRKNRVVAPVARGWHTPTGAFSTLDVAELLDDKTALVPAYLDVTAQLQRTRNNAELIRSGAEGPLAL